jgi:hypothetical protein
MLKENINLEAIKELKESSNKLENFFKNTDILAKIKVGNDFGVIHKFENNKVTMLFSHSEEITNDDVIRNSKSFDTINDAINYLREVRFDHAINYDIRFLTEPLLGELYKNRKIEIKDILGK